MNECSLVQVVSSEIDRLLEWIIYACFRCTRHSYSSSLIEELSAWFVLLKSSFWTVLDNRCVCPIEWWASICHAAIKTHRSMSSCMPSQQRVLAWPLSLYFIAKCGHKNIQLQELLPRSLRAMADSALLSYFQANFNKLETVGKISV